MLLKIAPFQNYLKRGYPFTLFFFFHFCRLVPDRQLSQVLHQLGDCSVTTEIMILSVHLFSSFQSMQRNPAALDIVVVRLNHPVSEQCLDSQLNRLLAEILPLLALPHQLDNKAKTG